jgi:hypothetical protein
MTPLLWYFQVSRYLTAVVLMNDGKMGGKMEAVTDPWLFLELGN